MSNVPRTDSPAYDRVRDFIRLHRQKNVQWNNIPTIEPPFQNIQQWLDFMIRQNFWPEEMTLADWEEIKSTLREYEANQQDIGEDESAHVVDGASSDQPCVPSGHPYSSWQLYRKELQNDLDEEDIHAVEKVAARILRRLVLDTSGKDPVKGLVIGHVQSGKTANLAGLVAMAADCGFNVFVVLSGTIENLRKQTEERLFKSLSSQNGNLHWNHVSHPGPDSPPQDRLDSLLPQEKQRYLVVSLKNVYRLEALYRWLTPSERVTTNLKILIIDDEADQAGINTASISEQERTQINNHIIRLTQVQAQAVNYVGYTATPYANVLNEAPGTSLYPKDFITTLGVSRKYFGPRQVFGVADDIESDGLDIVRTVPAEDLETISEIHKNPQLPLPSSLCDAIAWFTCAAAARRRQGANSPISMLIHTSHQTTHHDNLTKAIQRWLTEDPDQVIETARRIWEVETSRITREIFMRQLPMYPRKHIGSYPADFEIDLLPSIRTLLQQVSPILITGESQSDLDYHRGIHLCIDNSKPQQFVDDTSVHVRLVYPKKDLEYATSFIVVGGQTLSRGLTIKGLVSTYFLRSTTLGDSLMQMGRWFGYRNDYALFPRVWMTSDTYSRFAFLARVEEDLRKNLKELEISGRRPEEFAPVVTTHPVLSFLRISAKKKMQSAVPVSVDFSGLTAQTIHFRNDEKQLRANIDHALRFLDSLGEPSPGRKNAWHWDGVEFEQISQFLAGLHVWNPKGTFPEIDLFRKWFAETYGSNLQWTVIVAGSGQATQTPADDRTGVWGTSYWSVGKVKRSRLVIPGEDPYAPGFSIGALLDPKDLLADLPSIEDLSDSASNVRKNLYRIRSRHGRSRIPLLIVYLVDKKSEPSRTQDVRIHRKRYPLNTAEDILGVAVSTPPRPGGDSGTTAVSIPLSVGNNLETPDIADEDQRDA